MKIYNEDTAKIAALQTRITELEAELAKARGEVETMTIAMKYACECFDAAEFEGLSTVLQESSDERLKDLVVRRIYYGMDAVKDYFAAAPTEGQDNGGANGN